MSQPVVRCAEWGRGALRTQLGFCSRLRISARSGMSSIPATRRPYARAERWCVRRALCSSGSALLVVRLSALVGRLLAADAVSPQEAGGGAVRRISTACLRQVVCWWPDTESGAGRRPAAGGGSECAGHGLRCMIDFFCQHAAVGAFGMPLCNCGLETQKPASSV